MYYSVLLIHILIFLELIFYAYMHAEIFGRYRIQFCTSEKRQTLTLTPRAYALAINDYLYLGPSALEYK